MTKAVREKKKDPEAVVTNKKLRDRQRDDVVENWYHPRGEGGRGTKLKALESSPRGKQKKKMVLKSTVCLFEVAAISPKKFISTSLLGATSKTSSLEISHGRGALVVRAISKLRRNTKVYPASGVWPRIIRANLRICFFLPQTGEK